MRRTWLTQQIYSLAAADYYPISKRNVNAWWLSSERRARKAYNLPSVVNFRVGSWNKWIILSDRWLTNQIDQLINVFYCKWQVHELAGVQISILVWSFTTRRVCLRTRILLKGRRRTYIEQQPSCLVAAAPTHAIQNSPCLLSLTG